MKHIGCFISPHGFGHATRTCAVIEALQQLTEIYPHIFTTVPQSVFEQSIGSFDYNHLPTDVGFIQHNAFDIDMKATIDSLNMMLPFAADMIYDIAQKCRNMQLILCDICALGIVVAKQAGIPCVLIENFTWDWLYSPHLKRHPELSAHSLYLREIYASADYHIQTEPICSPNDQCDLHCSPIFRRIRHQSASIRKRFRCGTRKVVLVTFGGLGFSPSFMDLMAQQKNYFFVISGSINGKEKEAGAYENVMFLNRFSEIYHPDLINSADIVVFKSGYSTLAECYQAAKPTICVQRDGFIESVVLESFAKSQMNTTVISENEFMQGRWLKKLEEVSAPPQRRRLNGADDVADFLSNLISLYD